MVDKVIVISGPPGAGSSTVSKRVASKLRLKLFSAGELHKKMFGGWRNKETKAALAVWKTKVGSSEKTHKERDELIIKIAKEGKVVICAKLGIHFLKNASKYKIWLDAPLGVRAERSSKRDNIPVDDALKQISLREQMERMSWKKIYDFDYFDQKKDANLVIDASNLSPTQIVNKILEYVRKH